jgi:hypothetical protein
MLNSQSYHSDQFLKYLSLDMAQVVFSFTIQVSRCVLFLFLSYDNCLFFTYMLTYVFWHLSQLHQITDYWRLLDISLVQTARLFTLWRWGTVVLCKFLGNLKLFLTVEIWMKFPSKILKKLFFSKGISIWFNFPQRVHTRVADIHLTYGRNIVYIHIQR